VILLQAAAMFLAFIVGWIVYLLWTAGERWW